MSHILALVINLLLMMPFQPVFTAEPIPPQVEARMRGNSYPEGGAPEIRLSDLRYLRLSYYDFSGEPQTGEMVCNAAIAQDLLVRRMYVVAARLVEESSVQAVQLDLFDEPAEADGRERSRQEAILAIRRKFGTNAILTGTNFDEGATGRERHKQIGGHKA